jgi:5-methyltetrahydrofolate--homocysteine methyltransferase
MTVSADYSSALTTLETIRRVRDELHVRSILGVSNISFGLPQRSVVNAYFLAMAMNNGLSAAIINPNNAEIMAAYRSANALLGKDPNCMDYISAYADAPVMKAPAAVKPAQKETADISSTGPSVTDARG